MVGNVRVDRGLFVRPIAHRGLHNASAGLIENSLPAFVAAIDAGYGIECDVRRAADGAPVVFHDAELERLTVEAGLVSERTGDELQKLPLAGCARGSRVPSLADLLELVAGRVPMLVEVKSDGAVPDPVFISSVGNLVASYHGAVALMSFDAALIAALAPTAPQVPRGLATRVPRPGSKKPPGDLRFFDEVGASFIAAEAGALPSAEVAHLRAAGAPVFAWTVTSQAAWEAVSAHADAPIFEAWRP